MYEFSHSPVGQTSGLCTFWQCWAGIPDSPKIEWRIRIPTGEKNNNKGREGTNAVNKTVIFKFQISSALFSSFVCWKIRFSLTRQVNTAHSWAETSFSVARKKIPPKLTVCTWKQLSEICISLLKGVLSSRQPDKKEGRGWKGMGGRTDLLQHKTPRASPGRWNLQYQCYRILENIIHCFLERKN